MDIKEDDVSEFEDILREEEVVVPPGKEKEEKEEKEKKEELEESESKELEELEESEEEKEKESKKIDLPIFKEVTKKYPDLFKDFPTLRHAFFHAKEYREIFPTLDDARDAVEDLEGLRELENALSNGQPEDIIGVLDSIKELGDEALPSLAINFLSSIRKIDQDLYYKVITPELVNFTKSMYDAGLRNDNENLKNAALVASLHFFGDAKVASGEKKIESEHKIEKKDNRLEEERKSFRQERYTAFYNDVVNESDLKLSEIILDGIDTKNQMTTGIKDLVAEKVMKEITKTLSANPSHSSRMNALWKKASENGFSSIYKSKIIAAYLEAAEEIMPRIRAKVRASVLGIRERRSEEKSDSHEKRVEPKSNVGGGQRQSSSNKTLDAKKIDWKKTSDLDMIRDNVTLKS